MQMTSFRIKKYGNKTKRCVHCLRDSQSVCPRYRRRKNARNIFFLFRIEATF